MALTNNFYVPNGDIAHLFFLWNCPCRIKFAFIKKWKGAFHRNSILKFIPWGIWGLIVGAVTEEN